jgi:predicted transcriptional regulator
MQCNVLLISVKPEYANKIFEEQTKQVELRRVRTRVKAGDVVVIYASSPQKTFLGFSEVKFVTEKEASKKELKEFWEQVKDCAGINRKEFYKYYEGASVAIGIFLMNTKKFEKPIELDYLQQKLSYLRPPQSYRYLNENEYETIMLLGGENPASLVNTQYKVLQ